MLSKPKARDHWDDLKEHSWRFVEEEPQWWPGCLEGLPPGEAEKQIGTADYKATKGYDYLGPAPTL